MIGRLGAAIVRAYLNHLLWFSIGVAAGGVCVGLIVGSYLGVCR